jgi:hypothetical protein
MKQAAGFLLILLFKPECGHGVALKLWLTTMHHIPKTLKIQTSFKCFVANLLKPINWMQF